MALRNSERRWGEVSIAPHWVMAILILVLMLLGWMAETWHLSPTKLRIFHWHKSLGILVLTLQLRCQYSIQGLRLFPLPDIVPPDKGLKSLGQDLHLGLFWTLAALLVLHVSGALRHHFVLHDGILLRVLPEKGRGVER